MVDIHFSACLGSVYAYPCGNARDAAESKHYRDRALKALMSSFRHGNAPRETELSPCEMEVVRSFHTWVDAADVSESLSRSSTSDAAFVYYNTEAHKATVFVRWHGYEDYAIKFLPWR